MTRLISGVILAAAALAAILFLPLLALRVVAVVVAVLAGHEYLTIVGQRTAVPILVLVAIACWMVPMPGGRSWLIILLLAFGWLAIEVLGGATIHESGARFVAIWYIGVPLGMLIGWRSR
jgi:CDP-diglyceride synthetase